jgi:hypothetical protein
MGMMSGCSQSIDVTSETAKPVSKQGTDEVDLERTTRVRVGRGIYVQPNGKYAICAWHTGKLHFRTVQGDLAGVRQLRAR